MEERLKRLEERVGAPLLSCEDSHAAAVRAVTQRCGALVNEMSKEEWRLLVFLETCVVRGLTVAEIVALAAHARRHTPA